LFEDFDETILSKQVKFTSSFSILKSHTHTH